MCAFQCGAAKAEITPEKPDGLFGLMGIPYAGVIDPLYLRVLAFSDGIQEALLIAFDLDKAPNPTSWLPEIIEWTGIPEENITYIGTHTHTAPLTTYRPQEKQDLPRENRRAMEAYEKTVKEKLFACIQDALSNLRPAKIGWKKGESYINVNRNAEFTYEAPDGSLHSYVTHAPNDTAPVDRTVFVLKVVDENGAPMAFFVNYAVHCCTMFRNRYNGSGAMGISGDIAGTVSRYLETKFPDSVAIWSSSAAGDINPIIANELFYPDPADGSMMETLLPDWRSANEVMLSLAARHYADILSVIRDIHQMTDDVTVDGAIEWSETPSGDGSYRIRMHLLRLGGVALCGIGGELYSSFGKLIQKNAPMETVVINHDASLLDDCGYVLDDDTLVRVSRDVPVHGFVPGGRSTAVPGTVGPSLVTHTQSLFKKVL